LALESDSIMPKLSQSKTSKRKIFQRRKAALKGWVTRRANERKRSQAAKKGWITRRANERKRSQAAKKGWITRRANERKRISRRAKRSSVRSSNRAEYLIHFDYGTKKQHVQFQIHIIGPSDATDDEAIAVAIAIVLEVHEIEGWKFVLITYSHPPSPKKHPWDEALRPLYKTTRQSGARTVKQRTQI
jgi:hypothetical protein